MGYEELRDYIAGFEIRKVQIELSDQEEEEYNRYRDIFLSYIRRYNISLKGQFDFQNFIRRSWNREGREALLAWRKSRQIAFNARAKLDFVRYVLSKHRNAIVIQGSRKMEQKGTVILNQRPENLFKRVSLPYEVDPA